MRDHQALIHDYFGRPDSQPLRPKELAGELKVGKGEFNRFKAALEGLIAEGKLIVGKNKTVRPATISGLIQGTIKRTGKGNGFFRPNDTSALQPDESLYISPEDLKDAFTGDEVLVQLLRRRERGQRCGRVIEIISRGSQAFVGTYFERRQQGFVRIDGSQFEGPISVGDPGAKGVLPDDRVVVEMLRFPSQTDAGEAVITKVLGPRGAPGVDLLSIIHEFQLPDEFSENVLAEARLQAQGFEEAVTSDEMKVTSEDIPVENTLESGSSLSSRHSSLNPPPRVDLTRETIITIDPIDARDFDDAISLDREPDGNWRLGVHIADVAHFVRPGTLL
ncbi:MAG: RNB domain-containing ribonuclease, partial [Planctomycetes bacterium]|nr:RNB domain-containing ribonuclease [Planctomycetota bacterium]